MQVKYFWLNYSFLYISNLTLSIFPCFTRKRSIFSLLHKSRRTCVCKPCNQKVNHTPSQLEHSCALCAFLSRIFIQISIQTGEVHRMQIHSWYTTKTYTLSLLFSFLLFFPLLSTLGLTPSQERHWDCWLNQPAMSWYVLLTAQAGEWRAEHRLQGLGTLSWLTTLYDSLQVKCARYSSLLCRRWYRWSASSSGDLLSPSTTEWGGRMVVRSAPLSMMGIVFSFRALKAFSVM